ncbi:MAG: 5-formyltetrahydrofolate cyclo-ligase, partial [Alphaproteobacteria bacterium]|nr:5-formyltetrahydrofolate cyclo-ligase [Alphaproteobacteria bacterium]
SEPPTRAEIMAWRKAERSRLADERLAIDPDERRRFAAAIAAHLDRFIGAPAGRTVSVYWPFRGEPDLRPWMRRIAAGGGRCALPVVVAKRTPMVFRAWQPGCRLMAGVWNIPIPADGAEVVPDIVIAPVMGFDGAGYRLGYGGGFFDRTLAVLSPRPTAIGVGYARAAMATIRPLPHDIPMDAIVTERAVIAPAPPPRP